jgi:hypothetical protein
VNSIGVTHDVRNTEGVGGVVTSFHDCELVGGTFNLVT